MDIGNPIVILAIMLSIFMLIGGCIHRSGCRLCGFGREETLPLRGLMALLVVFGHLTIRTGHQFVLLEIFHWATPSVAVFFFLSGYGLFKSHSARKSEAVGVAYWVRFVARSLVKLLPPVFLVGFCLWMFRVATGTASDETVWVPAVRNCVLSFHDWFVWTLLLFYVLFALSFAVAGTARGILPVSVGVCAYWFVSRHVLGIQSYWWVTCFAFPVGLLFSRFEAAILNVVSRKGLVVPIVATALLAVVTMLSCRRDLPIVGKFKEPFFAVLGPVVAICLLYFNPLRKSRALCFLGGISYEIYVVHGLFEYAFFPLRNQPHLYVAMVVSVSVLAAVGLHRFNVFALTWFKQTFPAVSSSRVLSS